MTSSSQSETPVTHPERVRLYLGTGCGKTTATFGVVLRALATGKNVSMIFFDKLEENSSEGGALRFLSRAEELGELGFGKLTINYTGVNRIGTGPKGSFRLYSSPNGILPEDIDAAKQGLIFVTNALMRRDDIVICDELLDIGRVGILSWEYIRPVLELRQDPTVLILTGRKAPDWLVEQATTITTTSQEKHHGRAIQGLDC